MQGYQNQLYQQFLNQGQQQRPPQPGGLAGSLGVPQQAQMGLSPYAGRPLYTGQGGQMQAMGNAAQMGAYGPPQGQQAGGGLGAILGGGGGGVGAMGGPMGRAPQGAGQNMGAGPMPQQAQLSPQGQVNHGLGLASQMGMQRRGF